jgi:hypothetical protein
VIELVKMVLVCAIWVPYVLISERVKNTFTQQTATTVAAKPGSAAAFVLVRPAIDRYDCRYAKHSRIQPAAYIEQFRPWLPNYSAHISLGRSLKEINICL